MTRLICLSLISLGLIACGVGPGMSRAHKQATPAAQTASMAPALLTLPPVGMSIVEDERPGTCKPERVLAEFSSGKGQLHDLILRPEYAEGSCAQPEPARYYPLQLTGVRCGSRIYRGFFRERRPDISAMYHVRVTDHSQRHSQCEPLSGLVIEEMGPTGRLQLAAGANDAIIEF